MYGGSNHLLGFSFGANVAVADHPKAKQLSVVQNARQEETEDSCVICLATLGRADSQKLSCSHIFHAECIRELRKFGSSEACPLCRRPLTELRSVQAMMDEAATLLLRKVADGAAHERALASKAKAIVRDILMIDPNHVWAHVSLDCILMDQKSISRAVCAYNAALRCNSNLIHNSTEQHVRQQTECVQSQIFRYLAVALYDMHDMKGALDSMLAAHPIDAEGRSFLGLVMYEQGRLLECMREMRAALCINPSCFVALFFLGITNYDLGDLDGALISSVQH